MRAMYCEKLPKMQLVRHENKIVRHKNITMGSISYFCKRNEIFRTRTEDYTHPVLKIVVEAARAFTFIKTKKSSSNNLRMNKESNSTNWQLGETVILPEKTIPLKKDGTRTYERLSGSRYICVREATEGQRGILAKMLGRFIPERIIMVGGQPFCKDIREELFIGRRYFSYPFPSVHELKEVLDIISNTPSLLKRFEEARMPFNPQSSFWVRETASTFFIKKRPQFYDAHTDTLCTPSDDATHYRLTMAYFHHGEVTW